MKRRRLIKFDLHKTMFVLPNLFTLSSIFCGFYSVVLCSGPTTAAQITQSAMLIIFAIFFDGIDGRVARLTRTQSEFGVQLDSLADVISFGVAPSLLAYRYGLGENLGKFGIFVAFAFAACGAIRLARFNVLAQRGHDGPSKFFIGLPIPLAAGVMVAVILANQGNPLTAAGAPNFAVLMLVISYLMVSNVRYRTFKQIKSKKLAAVVLGVVAASLYVAARAFQPAGALVMGFAAYVMLGLVEEIVFFRARKRLDAHTIDVEETSPLFDDEEEDEESPTV